MCTTVPGHVQKFPVVHNPVKNQTQHELVTLAECGGETGDWYIVVGGGGDHQVSPSTPLTAWDS